MERNSSVSHKLKTNRVLVAFDGSDSSKNALKQAIEHSKKNGKTIVVATIPPSFERELESILIRNIKSIYRELAGRLLMQAMAVANEENYKIETVVGGGAVHEAIIEIAQSLDCGLIVMGRRGLSRADRVLMGSVTARVIGYSSVDVLVVPGVSAVDCRVMLLAVDGSSCSELAAAKAICITAASGGELKILSIVDIPTETYAEAPCVVEELLDRANRINKTVLESAYRSNIKAEAFIGVGDAHEKIVETAENVRAGIIIMGSHGRTGLMRLLMGSVTEKVIGNAKCPVYIVKV